MPKGRPKYKRRLDFWASPEQFMQLLGVAYMQGFAGKSGELSKAARFIMSTGLKVYIDGLDDKKRKEFDFILDRVRLQYADEFDQAKA